MGAVGGLSFGLNMVQRKNRNWIGYNKNYQVLMAVFLYNLYIFVWTSHSDLTHIPGLCV